MHVRVRKSIMTKTQVHADDVNVDEIYSPPDKDAIDDNSVAAFKKADKYWSIPSMSEKLHKVGEVRLNENDFLSIERSCCSFSEGNGSL